VAIDEEPPITATPALQLLRGIGAQLDLARQANPAWHADFEDRDPHRADRDTVAHLLDTAPNDYCRGLLAGVLLERQLAAAERGQRLQ
jgi:hypothetical protein